MCRVGGSGSRDRYTVSRGRRALNAPQGYHAAHGSVGTDSTRAEARRNGRAVQVFTCPSAPRFPRPGFLPMKPRAGRAILCTPQTSGGRLLLPDGGHPAPAPSPGSGAQGTKFFGGFCPGGASTSRQPRRDPVRSESTNGTAGVPKKHSGTCCLTFRQMTKYTGSVREFVRMTRALANSGRVCVVPTLQRDELCVCLVSELPPFGPLRHVQTPDADVGVPQLQPFAASLSTRVRRCSRRPNNENST